MKQAVYLISVFLLFSCSNKKQDVLHFESKSKTESVLNNIQNEKSLKDFQTNFDDLKLLDSLNYSDETIPVNLYKLINLRFLSLSTPLVKEYPKEIGDLINLRTLWIDWNFNVTVLPTELGKLKYLEHFAIVKTKLNEFPNQLLKLNNLKTIRITWCPNIKNLPQEIGNLTNLEVLDLSGNKIAFLPNSILNCKSLKKLGLLGNPISNDSLIEILMERNVEVFLDSYLR